MEKHVSLETAKRLDEAGWAKETQQHYGLDDDEKPELGFALWTGFPDDDEEYYYAPDIAELLEELPGGTFIHRYDETPKYFVSKQGAYVGEFEGDNLIELLAKLWIKLQEKS